MKKFILYSFILIGFTLYGQNKNTDSIVKKSLRVKVKESRIKSYKDLVRFRANEIYRIKLRGRKKLC